MPAILAARRDRQLAFLTWIVLTFFGVVVVEGGDFVPAWRFFIPVMPVLCVLAGEGLHQLVRRAASSRPPAGRQRALVVAVAMVAVLAAGLHAASTFQVAWREAVAGGRFTSDMTWVGISLRRHLPASARIALNPAGAIPYYSRLYAYDMFGLTNRHIARRRVPEMGSGISGHEKGDGGYILDQRPELILFGNVMIAPAGPLRLRGIRWSPVLRSEMEMAADPRFGALYTPDHLPLQDGRHLIFLRRRDFQLGATSGGSESAVVQDLP